jgi:D-cysteine desulfhydrase family pyridoxal phosphate-dependent enzyme
MNPIKVEDLQAKLNELNPVPLGHLPTPVEPLPRLSAALDGPELWVKRDDQTGLATGGNKVRKLAFLLAEAQRQGADLVMTTGARQSNHARQTAAAAARLGLACTLVLTAEGPTPAPQGNYLLDRLLGAEVCWAGDRPGMAALTAVAERLRQLGRRPYVIPYGGSNALGVCGYVAAMAELWRQMTGSAAPIAPVDAIVVASSSGGTQAGLLLGARALGYRGRILGVSIAERAAAFRDHIAALANDAARRLALDVAVGAEDVTVTDAYLGGGYGVLGDREREAITLTARTEGLLLDPVYTGRAMGGLIHMVAQGTFAPDERVLFWHTGGIPGLFAYAEGLVDEGEVLA